MHLKRWIRIGGIAGLAVGVVVTAIGLRVAGQALASRNWPRTTGVVERSEVEKTTHRRKGRRFTSYRPRVVYTYEVGGRTLTSDRISFGDAGIGVPGPAHAIAGRYREGATVDVAHHPDRPWEAVLVPGLTPGGAGLLLLGLGVCVVSLGTLGSAGWLARRLGGEIRLERMPQALWDGGPHRLEIDVSTSHPGWMDLSFSQERWDDEEEQWSVVNQATVEQELDEGDRRYTLRVPEPLSVDLEITLDEADPGAWIRVSVTVDGSLAWEDDASLDAPLRPGYAFSLEAELDDLIPASGRTSLRP